MQLADPSWSSDYSCKDSMSSKYLSHFPNPIANTNKTESKKAKKTKRKAFALVARRSRYACYEKKGECKSQINKIQFLAFIS